MGILFIFMVVFTFFRKNITRKIKSKKKIGNEYLKDEKLIILITKRLITTGKSLKYGIFSFNKKINIKKINIKKKYGDVKKNA